MPNRQIIIFFAVIAGVIALLIIGYVAQQSAQNPPEQTPQPITAGPKPVEQEYTDEIGDIMINGIETIQSTFTDVQYTFINSAIQNFAADNYPLAQNIKIDNTTFVQRDSTSWGFSVADQDNNRLFYVIATKLPDGQVKVDCYKS